MATTKQALTWSEIDPASLPEHVAIAYKMYKARYQDMKEARANFEALLNETASPPEGKRVVCGYNFGKLSIALADDDRKPAKAQNKGTLADFLASAQASGRRA